MLKPQKLSRILKLVIILAISCSCVHLLSLKRNRGGTTSRSVIITGPELTTLCSNLSLIWSSTQDKTLRKFNFPNCYRYGLWFQFVKNTSHLVMLILLAGDIATNPGPHSTNCYNIHCLYFNASEHQTMVTDLTS